MTFTAQQIADFLKGEIIGNPDVSVQDFSKIEDGKPQTISFLSNPKYTHYIYETQADIVLVNNDFEPEKPTKPTLIKVANAYTALASLLELVNSLTPAKTGVEEMCHISPSAKTGKDIYVGAFAYIGDNAHVGDNVIITADPDDGYRVKEVVVLDTLGYAVPVSCLSVGGDPDYVETWSFTMPASNVEIYVTFEVQGSSYYDDVRTDQWYYNAVTFVTDRGYFFGVETNLFGPYINMNRAMFVTVLGRMSGVDTSLYTGQAFSDVDTGDYYAPYVQWAADNGIVLGRTATTFDPNAFITREEMAAIMYRYCEYLGMDMTLKNQVFMDRYTDKGDISDWALEYVKWAVGVGLMRGKTPYTINPLENATRAEVAQVIMNLCDKVIYP